MSGTCRQNAQISSRGCADREFDVWRRYACRLYHDLIEAAFYCSKARIIKTIICCRIYIYTLYITQSYSHEITGTCRSLCPPVSDRGAGSDRTIPVAIPVKPLTGTEALVYRYPHASSSTLVRCVAAPDSLKNEKFKLFNFCCDHNIDYKSRR